MRQDVCILATGHGPVPCVDLKGQVLGMHCASASICHASLPCRRQHRMTVRSAAQAPAAQAGAVGEAMAIALIGSRPHSRLSSATGLLSPLPPSAALLLPPWQHPAAGEALCRTNCPCCSNCHPPSRGTGSLLRDRVRLPRRLLVQAASLRWRSASQQLMARSWSSCGRA